MITPVELKDQEGLLERIHILIKDFPSLTPAKRHNPRRVKILRAILRDLTRYQENQMNMLVTLKGMRTAIENEFKLMGLEV